MKKEIKIVLLFILLILNVVCFSACYNKNDNISSKPLLYKDFNYFKDNIEFKNYYREKIELETGIDEQREILLTNLFNAQNFLAHLDVKYKIISRAEMIDITAKLNINAFSGLYNPKNNEILIVEYDKDTSIHEMGHAIYFQLLTNAGKSNISIIFNQESKKLLDKYGQESEEEFFAVAFTEYIYSPETLSANCPNIYNFINDLSNKLN